MQTHTLPDKNAFDASLTNERPHHEDSFTFTADEETYFKSSTPRTLAETRDQKPDGWNVGVASARSWSPCHSTEQETNNDRTDTSMYDELPIPKSTEASEIKAKTAGGDDR